MVRLGAPWRAPTLNLALYPQSFLDEVRAAADIVTVVSDYVSLRKWALVTRGSARTCSNNVAQRLCGS